ncbi:MAG: RNA methyltransferase [Acetobacteraceae bacterium]|nr:RNA methyltransferase [Acetobacteraceae bacterium]
MNTDTICGLNAVTALFRHRPEAVERLFYTEEMKPIVGPWCHNLAAQRKPYRMLGVEEMNAAAYTTHHGGIAAVAKSRYIPILDLNAIPKHQFLLILDGIGNPHNLGAIARSAAFFGVKAMLIGEGPGHALPSDAAYRVAEGGLEMLDIYRTRALPQAIEAMRKHYRTVATAIGPDTASMTDLPHDRPIALVLGNEETGVAPDVLAVCRRRVQIVGAGKVQSLNVAQAAAVLLSHLAMT